MTFLSVVGALLYVAVTLTNGCFVLAPNRIRLDSNETLAIFVEGQEQNVVVTVMVYPLQKNNFFTWRGNVTSGTPQVIDFVVKEEYFPDLEQGSDSPAEVLVKAQCGTLPTVGAHLVVTQESANNIFIQTDKPVYRPGEQVNVLIISLDGRLRPLHKPFLVAITNPHGHTVEEKELRAEELNRPVIDLPRTAILGTWSVVVRSRRLTRVLATKSFKVDKYVLPLFTVKTEGKCSYILDNTASLQYTVSAKFADGRNVDGKFSFRFGTKGDGDKTRWITADSSPTALNESGIIITQEQLKNNHTADEWQALFRDRKKLVFEATVTDGATGVNGKHSHDGCIFTKSPFVISFGKSVRTYKPRMKVYVLVEVSFPDGKPAPNIRLQATAKNAALDNNTAHTDKGGQATFQLHSDSRSTITVTVSTAAEHLSEEQQAKESIEIKPYQVSSIGYLAIERRDPRNIPKVTETYKAVLALQPTNWNPPIYYVATAKGRVVNAGMVTHSSNTTEHSFQIVIKEEMVPSFRVVVFSKLADDTIVTDSVYMKAESHCGDWLKYSLDSNAVGFTFGGPEGAVVTLVGVDSMLLHHGNHLMTNEMLSTALDTKDLGCGVGGGTDADEDFLKSGVFLLSEKTTVRHDILCQHRQRTKREATWYDEEDDDMSYIGLRRDIREMFIFGTTTIRGGQGTYTASFPDAVTTWTVGAIRVSPEGGICVAGPLQVKTAMGNILLDIRVPYSVMKNEHIQLPVTVYNKGKTEANVTVFLHKTPGICTRTSGGSRSDKMNLTVPSGRGITVIFPMAAIETGQATIHATATSQGMDSLMLPLRVELPGLPQTKSKRVVIDPRNQRRRKHLAISTQLYTDEIYENKTQRVTITSSFADQAVPGTQKYEISVIGVKPVPVVKAAVVLPARLLSSPVGDAARIMTRLATAVYAYSYGKATDTSAGGFSRNAHGFISRGLAVVKQYRKANGAFGFDGSGPPSVWATSFVLRSLCEAKKWIDVDDVVLKTGLSYLIGNQMRNGGFQDVTGVGSQWSMVGGVTGPAELSAYTVLTIAECFKGGVQVPIPNTFWPRSSAYLERYLLPSSHYGLAIGAYALSISNSSSKSRHLNRMKSVVVHRTDENIRHIRAATNGLINEATAYAMLAFINEQEDPSYISGFTRRLNKHLKLGVAFSTTQETVVGMQALAYYAAYTKWNKVDLTIDVTLLGNPDFKETISVQQDTSHILKNLEIPNPGSAVYMNIRGVGIAMANITYTFNKDEDKECLVQIKTHVREWQEGKRRTPKKRPTGTGRSQPYMTEVCLRALGTREIEQLAVEVGLFTGFEPDIEHLEEAKKNGSFVDFEKRPRSIHFKLSSITHNKDVCLYLIVRDVMKAGNIQASYIHVHSKNNPDVDCTKFYGKEKGAPFVKMLCDEDQVCKCAEGGCPPTKYLKLLSNDTELNEFMCEKVDFAWRGILREKWDFDGFIYAKFDVNKTIKQGSETKEGTGGNVRTVRMLDRCTDTSISVNDEYIFLGKESHIQENDSYAYVIDATSIWISVSEIMKKVVERKRKRARQPSPEEAMMKRITEFAAANKCTS
ncbi:complement C3-like isoform X2 [Ornithodoros turicata]